MADEKKGFTPEEEAYIKTALADVETKMGTKAADQIKEKVEAAFKVKENELSELKQFKVDAEKEIDKFKKNQEWIDKQIAKGDVIEVKETGSPLNRELKKALEGAKDRLTNFKNSRTPVSFELKVVGDIAAGNFTVSGTPAFAHGGPLWEPGRKGYEMSHIRDIGVRVVSLPPAMDTYVIRDAGGEGGPTSVAAGNDKPQSDRDYVKTIVPITKIAHYYKIPEEYLADITWLQDEIVGVGVEELLLKEDSMFLTNSAGGEFLGLNQTFNSTAYSTPASLAGLFTGSITANNYDVLVAAWTQKRNIPGITTGVLLYPSDYARMILTKDTTGQYPFGAPNQNIPNLFGAPIIAHTAVTSDKFFLGDFSKVKVGVRSPLSVRFYDQNEDDAIKNMVTVVIEERVTMAADRADRIIYGDFSDARTALES